MIKGVLESIN